MSLITHIQDDGDRVSYMLDTNPIFTQLTVEKNFPVLKQLLLLLSSSSSSSLLLSLLLLTL